MSTTNNHKIPGDLDIVGALKKNGVTIDTDDIVFSNTNTISIGSLAGESNQGTHTIAIGVEAGQTNQGFAAIAVGRRAGETNQGANSIILNATGVALDSTTASSFHVKPVRGGNFAASALAYTADGEIVEETNVHFDTTGRVGIGTTSPSAPLDVPGGIASPGFHAQYGLTCAGLVTWTGTHLSWVHRIIAIPVERTEFGADGYLDMYVPTSGTSITFYNANNTISTVSTTSDGFPIGQWEALWYVVTPGQSNSTVNSQYVITHYQNTSWKPNSNWLLLAVRNGDTNQQPYLKFIPTNGNYYTWIAPTFGTNWGNYGGSYNTAGYYRDGDGVVYLKGLVTGGSYGSTATLFTLPAGFRPGGRHLFSIISDNAHGRLDIQSTGQVIPYVGSGWMSLDGISFKAEQ